MSESYGTECQLCVDSAAQIGTSSIPIIIDSFSSGDSVDILSENGMTGSRSQRAERVREGNGTYQFQLGMSFTPTSMAFFLQYILGGTPSGTSYALAESLPSFVTCVDLVAKVITYSGCKISRATFTGSKGSPMIKASLDCMATGRSVGNAGTFPSLTTPTDPPYVFAEAVMTLQSASRQMSDFTLTIDNAVQPNEANEQFPSELNSTDRIITLECTSPFNSTEIDLFNQAVAGAAGSLVLTNGGYSTTFTFGNLKAKRNMPGVSGKTARIPQKVSMQAFQTGSTKELAVTHDSTA